MLDDIVEQARQQQIFCRERTAIEQRVLGAFLYHAGQSFRKITEFIDRSHVAVHDWYHRLAPLFEPDPGDYDTVAIDETKLFVEDREGYVWAAVDVDSFEVVHVEVTAGRSSLDALLFFRTVFERCRGQPLLLLDRGPWYDWAVELFDCEGRRATFGDRSLVEAWFSVLKYRTLLFWHRFPYRSSVQSANRWARAFALLHNALLHNALLQSQHSHYYSGQELYVVGLNLLCMNRRGAMKALMTLGAGGVGGSAGCASSQSKALRTIDDVNAETGWSNLIAKATIGSSEISENSQGIVELGVEWRGETAERFSFGNTVPISSPVMSRAPEGLILATEDSGVVSNGETGWIAEDDSVLTSLDMTSVEFRPNEAESNEYLLWGSPDHFEEIRSGDYHFETTISIIDDRTPENHDFTVDISIS